MASRKRIMTFYAVVRVHQDDAERLLNAVADRPTETLELQDRDDELESQGWVSYFVKYGPVRGANRHDMVKFFDRLGLPYSLSARTETEYVCGCDNRAAPCVAKIYRDGAGGYRIWRPRPSLANAGSATTSAAL